MRYTKNLIKAAILKAGSAYKLAPLIGVTEQAISKWRNGHSYPDTGNVYKLADFLGKNRADVLSTVMAEKHADHPQGDFWDRLAPRVLPATITALVVAGFGGGARAAYAGSGIADKNSQPGFTPVYIMRTLRRVLRRRLLIRFGEERARSRRLCGRAGRGLERELAPV